MGTNFYWHVDPLDALTEPSENERHIGKRSAAGKYCWDCDLTLCADGNAGVHTGVSEWYDRCPRCGREPAKVDNLKEGPAAIELGFASPRVERATGVRGASSFSWAQDPERVGAICEKAPDEQIIEDEYGGLLTGREFLDMLRANCPIQFTDGIGEWFS